MSIHLLDRIGQVHLELGWRRWSSQRYNDLCHIDGDRYVGIHDCRPKILDMHDVKVGKMAQKMF